MEDGREEGNWKEMDKMTKIKSILLTNFSFSISMFVISVHSVVFLQSYFEDEGFF